VVYCILVKERLRYYGARTGDGPSPKLRLLVGNGPPPPKILVASLIVSVDLVELELIVVTSWIRY